MESVFQKEQAIQKNVAKIEADYLNELVDQYCALRVELDPEIAALKIKSKELEEVEKQLLEELDKVYPVESAAVRKTQNFLLELSAKGKATTITDKKLLIKFLGLDTFLELAEISITDMRKYLTEQQVKLVSTEIHKNKRKLKYAKA